MESNDHSPCINVLLHAASHSGINFPRWNCHVPKVIDHCGLMVLFRVLSARSWLRASHDEAWNICVVKPWSQLQSITLVFYPQPECCAQYGRIFSPTDLNEDSVQLRTQPPFSLRTQILGMQKGLDSIAEAEQSLINIRVWYSAAHICFFSEGSYTCLHALFL